MSRKTKISLFCVLNLATVVWANLPEWAVALSSRTFVQMGSPAEGGPCIECGRYWLGRYAHVTGFSAPWKLFTGLPRYNYRITIRYTYQDGTVEERPRPYPEHAWAFTTPFFNHRENKIDLNILSNDATRIAFARWLCREEEKRGRAVYSVHVLSRSLDIPPLAEAGGPPDDSVTEHEYPGIACGYGEAGVGS
jgi:hypothetical protein